MKKTKEKMIIIDGNALIHRSFHALPPTISTKDGKMVNAVYGFASVLIKSIRDIKPDYAVLTLDRKAPTFRHDKFKEYKAKREKAPDELYAQIPEIKKLAQAFDLPIYEMDGYEADDLIGTISRTVNNGIEKIIVTGDMDTLQLIDNDTKVYTMSRGITESVTYDENKVMERFGGLKPNQMIDYKALRGDPSDNIPGVRGIGEKTAIELLAEFGDLDNIYKNLESDKIKVRIKSLLKEHEKEAYLSRELASIKCDVEIGFDLEKTKVGVYNIEKIADLFSKLEFKSLLPRVHALANGASITSEAAKERAEAKFKANETGLTYTLIKDEKSFEKFFSKLSREKYFAFDTETGGLDPITSDLLGIGFCWNENEAYFLSFKESAAQSEKDTLFNYIEKNSDKIHPWIKRLKPIFEDEKIKKAGHNIKFDIRVLKNAGINTKGLDFDTMIASYLLNPGTRQHNLDALSFSELGLEKISKEDLLGKGRGKIEFSQVDTVKLCSYCCEDSDCAFKLAKKLKTALIEKESYDLFNEIEMPLVPILAQMEENGVKLDVHFLAGLNKKFSQMLNSLEKEIHKIAGMEFNINSTLQLREVLFEKLEIPTIGVKRTKTGLSTAAEELDKLQGLHPIIKLIQEHRELAKLMSTYVETLPALINPKTGRVHTSFNQSITATGRLSSSDPNLQNIPIRTPLGREIRKAFIAEQGFKLLGLDYSQIELRLAAHLSEDKKMIEAFQNGLDIHAATAAEINKIPLKEVTPQMRREAKATNFGILYGQGPQGLSRTADIPYAQAREFIEKYFESFSEIKKYVENSIKSAREKGYAETIFGRRRYLPEINSSVMMIKKTAERMAINTPLQGSNADIIKIAMIKIAKEAVSGNIKMISQVHDELLFEVKESEIEAAAQKIKVIMENVIKLKVPVIVDVKIGENWEFN
jgi:DNA polymerase I